MWRALFHAIGVMLIVVGLECTVVQQFKIASDAKLPKFVDKMLAQQGKATTKTEVAQFSPEVAPPQPISGYGGWPQPVSQYGPSRISRTAMGNDQFFAQNHATSLNSSTSSGNTGQFSLAGFGARLQSPSPTKVSKPAKVKQLSTKDWMPWSLIAAGTIIVLYTKSLGRFEFAGTSGGE